MDFLISDAMAQSGPAAGPGLGGLIFPIALIAIFYFLLIRPQQKRAKEHKKLVANLGKGDEVITNGGLMGQITDVGEGYAALEIADGVEVRIQKSAVAQVLPKGTVKQKLKKDEVPAVLGKGKAEGGKSNK
ncbi:preprotein translocase subunit YajC [Nitrococcus mobilis]|uniref:Sec translocon accessory complex subunit YajC n=1 Tax=Nitrococcus mobilis Nb-231 TaxID=314278 RepID=A4BSU1_9GAMM|nr:preprotein translocase subunit YajC [Nitrococcus mobilis]EAR21185.1 preprotein translocase subunit YajC [Nitrococcus mobilis Nb-231]